VASTKTGYRQLLQFLHLDFPTSLTIDFEVNIAALVLLGITACVAILAYFVNGNISWRVI